MITSIRRDWGVSPNIVRITTTDTLQEITTDGYLDDQASVIEDLNHGEFTWTDTDQISIVYADGSSLFTRDAENAKFVPMSNQELLQYLQVPITAAEFNGMYAAPKLLVPAPGADRLLLLDKLVLVMTYNSAAFAAGGVAAVQYDDTANGAGVIASTTLAAATFQATASTSWTMNAGVVAYPFTTTVNQGLYLSNITGAFTTGDSPMVGHVWYKTIATA